MGPFVHLAIKHGQPILLLCFQSKGKKKTNKQRTEKLESGDSLPKPQIVF
jgi:hypothetical protein